MFDNETIMMVAKFMREVRTLNIQVKSNRLFKDAAYRDEIFDLVEKEANEDLLVLILSIKNKLGALNNVEAAAPVKTTNEPSDFSNQKKYMLGPRS